MKDRVLVEAEGRIRRLVAAGGVDLARMSPEEKLLLLPPVRVGTYATGIKFQFRCPLCRVVRANDQEMEMLCTGPSWTDDHEPTLMEMIK